jgi:hypothetical protein
MRYDDIPCASDIYRNWISAPLTVFHERSTGIPWRRNTIFLELLVEEQGRGIGVGRLNYTTRRFNDGVRICDVSVWPLRTDVLPSSVDFDPKGYEYLELADIVRHSKPFRNHSPPMSIYRQECERERRRYRYKGEETVRRPATSLPDNSGIRDREWSIGGWSDGHLLG